VDGRGRFVQSLGTADWEVAEAAESVRAAASRALVLPHFLRKPVRMLRRLDWQLPRHIGVKGALALFLATAVTGVVAGGNSMTVASAVTAWVGFGIENVRITGQSETNEVSVLAALDIGTYPSLLTLDIEAARERIEQLPWVKRASLKKLFPDTLEISVVERQPYALWQHGGTISLVDNAGKVITDSFSDRYASLPRVIGAGADKKVAEYTAMLDRFPTIARRTRGGILFSEDRWTLVLDNGIELMLPADDPDKALATVAALDANDSLLSREIAAIDLRQPGPMVVRLTADGMVARKAALKERDIASKKRTNI
jgi:cell division protein FtsQ